MTDQEKVKLGIRAVGALMDAIFTMPCSAEEFVGYEEYQKVREFMYETGTWERSEEEEEDGE